ncbi:inorganic phosphate transporter 1-11-like [Olea europaea subsp. europaea]|uniref:Inorganic phosphate transporter 1-11-like n=1 Tax=Olea europaea subsp. europaea TaxID=158383 RepID=A0A8S0SB89_OLEEU|nr:inorganic phosphate transporter 1-11-like [Olea europaea subsp. europaea]
MRLTANQPNELSALNVRDLCHVLNCLSGDLPRLLVHNILQRQNRQILNPNYVVFYGVQIHAYYQNTLGLPNNRKSQMGVYGVTCFFANFGHNSTTFVLPAELFPMRVRSTCHMQSAASGKRQAP